MLAEVGAPDTSVGPGQLHIHIIRIPPEDVYKRQGSVYTAAPGYLIQSDVLAVLGNILKTRDDTFTVRAYGELANREGVVLARAWCEAGVQRGINYVDVDKRQDFLRRP